MGGLKRNIGVLYLTMEWVGEMVRYLLIQRTLRKAKQSKWNDQNLNREMQRLVWLPTQPTPKINNIRR